MANHPDWLPIETCPKDPWYGPFLVFDANSDVKKIKICEYWGRGETAGIRDVNGGFVRYASHWMPLPSFPDPLPKRPHTKLVDKKLERQAREKK